MVPYMVMLPPPPPADDDGAPAQPARSMRTLVTLARMNLNMEILLLAEMPAVILAPRLVHRHFGAR
ncbi:hypothetical protein CR51_39565 [Caballeronia megalochromosomata]|jgi:hypothetical protein|nr:hypothetical protein CR51_39565 [Caballeronia megalochromosomata]